MKRSPEEADLLKNFGPSKFSAGGFLGTDPRSVEEIVTSDIRALDMAGTDRETVARALREIFERAREAQGSEIEIMAGVRVRYFESRGRIPSPFRGEGAFEKGEVVVRGLPASGEIIITRLSIHLVETHSFFQGRGQRYRIEPEAAIALAAGLGG